MIRRVTPASSSGAVSRTTISYSTTAPRATAGNGARRMRRSEKVLESRSLDWESAIVFGSSQCTLPSALITRARNSGLFSCHGWYSRSTEDQSSIASSRITRKTFRIFETVLPLSSIEYWCCSSRMNTSWSSATGTARAASMIALGSPVKATSQGSAARAIGSNTRAATKAQINETTVFIASLVNITIKCTSTDANTGRKNKFASSGKTENSVPRP